MNAISNRKRTNRMRKAREMEWDVSEVKVQEWWSTALWCIWDSDVRL